MGANYEDVAQGHILKDVIPKEAAERVEHLSSAKEMFEILGKVYGNAETSVSLIVNKLLYLKLTKKMDYEKVLELCLVLNRQRALLRLLDGEAINHLRYNTNVVAHAYCPMNTKASGTNTR